MPDNDIKSVLPSTGQKIYTPEQQELAFRLLDFTESLNLDKNTLITSYFSLVDTSNPEVCNLILDTFGTDILKRVELLSRISNINFPETKKKISGLRQLFIELTTDLSSIFIKLSERLITLRKAEEDSSPELKKIAEECLYLYSPIAHRLGIRRIYTEMDDISFKVLHPDEFRRLSKIIEKRRADFERKLTIMGNNISELLEKNNIRAQIQKRVKRLYSIYLKLENKGVTLNQVYDLMALRIVTNKVENCYQTLGMIHSKWLPIEGRFKDWITFPKPNGYRSIQTTILTRSGDKFEIQIRTEEMHREAEYGSAAHWAYKENVNAKSNWIPRLKEFLENDEYFNNPYELHNFLKADLKRDYIHILTPKGDIITLPHGSTPIDFSYAIHSEVGNKTTGARINGKFAKLKTELHSGDVVDIITSKKPNPSRDWLEFVKTSKARSKILLWLKKNEQEQIIAEGKRLWEKFKKRFKSKLENIDEEQSFKKNLLNVGFKTADDFYSAIAIKSLKPKLPLLRRLYPDAFRGEESKRKHRVEKPHSADRSPQVEVEGLKGIKTTLAGCCNPIKGEEIIAYITRMSELKIHSADCRYILSQQFDTERLKTANWVMTESAQKTKIKVFGENYNDILKAVVEQATSDKITISNSSTRNVGENIVSILFELEVKDISHLKEFIRKIKAHPPVESIKTA